MGRWSNQYSWLNIQGSTKNLVADATGRIAPSEIGKDLIPIAPTMQSTLKEHTGRSP